jgi:hypothetical protein
MTPVNRAVFEIASDVFEILRHSVQHLAHVSLIQARQPARYALPVPSSEFPAIFSAQDRNVRRAPMAPDVSAGSARIGNVKNNDRSLIEPVPLV